jgi:hypothetical protein
MLIEMINAEILLTTEAEYLSETLAHNRNQLIQRAKDVDDK